MDICPKFLWHQVLKNKMLAAPEVTSGCLELGFPNSVLCCKKQSHRKTGLEQSISPLVKCMNSINKHASTAWEPQDKLASNGRISPLEATQPCSPDEQTPAKLHFPFLSGLRGANASFQFPKLEFRKKEKVRMNCVPLTHSTLPNTLFFMALSTF